MIKSQPLLNSCSANREIINLWVQYNINLSTYTSHPPKIRKKKKPPLSDLHKITNTNIRVMNMNKINFIIQRPSWEPIKKPKIGAIIPKIKIESILKL